MARVETDNEVSVCPNGITSQVTHPRDDSGDAPYEHAQTQASA